MILKIKVGNYSDSILSNLGKLNAKFISNFFSFFLSNLEIQQKILFILFLFYSQHFDQYNLFSLQSYSFEILMHCFAFFLIFHTLYSIFIIKSYKLILAKR